MLREEVESPEEEILTEEEESDNLEIANDMRVVITFLTMRSGCD